MIMGPLCGKGGNRLRKKQKEYKFGEAKVSDLKTTQEI